MFGITGLLPALIEGIPVLVSSEIQTEAGRKIVLHDYPNSPDRYVEDQGELPAKFSMSVFVTGTGYAIKAMLLEHMLKKGGKITIIMPSFGIKQLFALPYTKDTTQRAVGEIKFNLQFVDGTDRSGPTRLEATMEKLHALADKAMAGVKGALGVA